MIGSTQLEQFLVGTSFDDLPLFEDNNFVGFLNGRKAVGNDGEAGKATCVSLLGVDGARARGAALVEEAGDSLAGYADRAGALKGVARFVVTRKH